MRTFLASTIDWNERFRSRTRKQFYQKETARTFLYDLIENITIYSSAAITGHLI